MLSHGRGFDLGSLIELYVDAKEYENLSQETTGWYRKRLRMFKRWLDEQGLAGIAPEEVSIEHAQRFAADLRTKPGKRGKSLTPVTVKGYMQIIKGFYTWLEEENYVVKNPMARLKMPKVPQTLPPAITPDKTKKLIETAKRLGYKEHAVIALFIDSGIRVGELTNLTLDSGIRAVQYGEVRVYGKGAKERDVPVGKETRQALRRYLTLERPEDADTNALWVSRKTGEGMTPQGIRQLVRRVGKEAGIPDIWPHLLRHTSAYMFVNMGGGEFALQKMLGHTTLEMTRRYTNLTNTDLKRIHERASPVDNLRARRP